MGLDIQYATWLYDANGRSIGFRIVERLCNLEVAVVSLLRMRRDDRMPYNIKVYKHLYNFVLFSIIVSLF